MQVYTVRKLQYLTSKVVFYECLNSILVFQSDGFYYCPCDQFSSCKSYIGCRGYCYICRISDHFSTSTIENIKYDPLELIKFAIELFNQIKLCYEFDNSINFFWKKDYEYRWRNHDGETGRPYFKDCDYFCFFRIKNVKFAYKIRKRLSWKSLILSLSGKYSQQNF